jgi:hypothetical protein
VSERNYNLIEAEKGVPVKACTKGVAIEAAAGTVDRGGDGLGRTSAVRAD